RPRGRRRAAIGRSSSRLRAYRREHRREGEAPPSPQCVRDGGCCSKSRRRPTLPEGLPSSTIGAGGLHFRVRNGNGCFPAAITTGNLCSCHGLPHESSRASTSTSKKDPKPSAD